MARMLGRSDGMEQFDPVPCNSWVEFDSDPIATTWAIDSSITNPHLNADPGTIIAFPGEILGRTGAPATGAGVSPKGIGGCTYE